MVPAVADVGELFDLATHLLILGTIRLLNPGSAAPARPQDPNRREDRHRRLRLAVLTSPSTEQGKYPSNKLRGDPGINKRGQVGGDAEHGRFELSGQTP